MKQMLIANAPSILYSDNKILVHKSIVNYKQEISEDVTLFNFDSVKKNINSKLKRRIELNLGYCGMPIDRLICDNCGKRKDVVYNCNNRICHNKRCVEHRAFYVRHLFIEPRFRMYDCNNSAYFVLTFKYDVLDFNNPNIIPMLRKCVYDFIDLYKNNYGFKMWTINADVIKKHDGKFHIHFNLACEIPKYYSNKLLNRNFYDTQTKIMREHWSVITSKVACGTKYLSFNPIRKKEYREKVLSYFVWRTAECNPIEPKKRGVHLNISVDEYILLFYKRHFLTFRHWGIWEKRKIEKLMLVISSNTRNERLELEGVCHVENGILCGKYISETFQHERWEWINSKFS